MAWPETVVPVDADKNTEQRVETGDGEIVINEGEIQGDSGITAYEETDWNKVEDLRKVAPKLAIPKYIPDGYNFDKINVEIYEEDGFSAGTTFKNNNLELYINQRQYNGDDSKVTRAKGNFEIIECNLGKVYLSNNKNEPILATVYLTNGQLNINGDISKEDIIKMLNNIEMP
nr:DUF4367 domain-containing protein [Ihubacter massiliensis]